MKKNYFPVGRLTLAQLQQMIVGAHSIQLDYNTQQDIFASHQVVLDHIQQHKTVYGINTGFGLLADQRIDDAALKQLQWCLVNSHTAGVGDYLPARIAKLILP